MASNFETLREKIQNILAGYGFEVEKRDDEGNVTSDVALADYFAVQDPGIYIIVDPEQQEVRLKVAQKDKEIGNDIRKSLKQLSLEYNVNLDYKLLSKTRKVNQQESTQENDMADVMEGFGNMYGGAKTSYQPLDNVKIVVKHRKPVNEESRGARSRNIHSIYIQRGEERFKMAENNLKAARAMARHLNMGGETFDSVGTAIVEMAAEQRKLKEFARYVTSKGLVNETNEEYVTLAKENIANIKHTLDKLCGVKTYANAVESLQDMANVEILEDDIDLEGKFTETHFDSRVSDAMDSIKRSMSRQYSYRSSIEKAIAKENFSNLKNTLHETDMVDFASPQARLSYQVSQMGHAAQNSVLRNHLIGISKKIGDGQHLGQFEYDTIKSCLLSAKEARVRESSAFDSVAESYTKFIESFDIL